jgi:hypothetical protein
MAPTSSVFALLLLWAALPIALGHDHDSTHIKDGEAISDEPIVRVPPQTKLVDYGL